MADSATSRFKARKQSLGSNVNTWGDDKLNDVLDLFDRGGKGYQAVALTGDVTWTWTNYATSNAGQVAIVKFTGSLSSAATVTVPSTEWVWLMWNAAGAAVTVKTSAGSGVTLQNGDRAVVYNDGTDVVNIAPTLFPSGDVTIGGKIDGLTAGTASGEAVEYDQLNAAIAAGGGSGAADGSVKVDALAASVFLGAALTASATSGIDISDDGDSLGLSVDLTELEAFLALAGKLTDTFSSGTNAMTANRRYRISATATGTLPTFAVGEFCIVEFTVGAGVTGTVGRNSQTIDGASEDDTYLGDGGSGPVVLYTCTSAGVVTSQLVGSVP